MVKDEKLVLWSECMQELRSSGQSMGVWRLEHKISTSIMGYWMRKMVCNETSEYSDEEFVPEAIVVIGKEKNDIKNLKDKEYELFYEIEDYISVWQLQ